MGSDRPPAIRRNWTQADSDADILGVIEDKTRFHRGHGTTGQRVEHVEHTCPFCANTEMVRDHRYHVDGDDDASYWCLNPRCQYFIADELSWATTPHPEHVPDGPMEWDNTAECPSCGDRHTVTVRRHSRLHRLADEGTSCIIETICDACADEILADIEGEG